MKEGMLDAPDRGSERLKALAGRSRLMILCHLWEGETSVGQLVRLTGARDTSVSQQLALLRKDGIVAARRDGQTLYYSIAHEGAARVLETLHGVFCQFIANSSLHDGFRPL